MLGIEGVSLALDNAKKTPLRQFCAGSLPITLCAWSGEQRGRSAREEIARLLELPEVLGIAGNHELCGCMQGDERE